MTLLDPVSDIDVADLRRAFSGFPSGVAALAATVDGDATILIASSFTVGVSQDPPLVMFAVQHSSTTWPTLSKAAVLGVSILGEHHASKARQLAAKERAERLHGIPTHVTADGALFLHHAPVWMACTIQHVYPAGDHDIVVLRVGHVRTDFDHDPLIWHRAAPTLLARCADEVASA